MSSLQTLTTAPTLEVLRNQFPSEGLIIYLAGKNSPGDGISGFFRWDSTATGAEDGTFMKSFPSNRTSNGRWVRVFQTVQVLPQGILVLNAGIRKLYSPGLTDSGGTSSLNLTMENTPTGTPIFTEIWSNQSEANQDITSVSGIISSVRKTLSPNLKTTTHLFYRPNTLSVAVGTLYEPLVAAPSGVKVRFTLEGI